ncbi:uncharacterized protein BKA78DRAFT_376418 [Phyllosticta capitalensis]|uniref:uncharacterized protein n=1 Tax=Phyllosticta capitalensis TaxID=121624 RepID=UPI00313146CC
MEPPRESIIASISAPRLEAFFNAPDTPTRAQCDEHSLSLTGRNYCMATASQGCHSYTLICYDQATPHTPIPDGEAQNQIVQFRLASSELKMDRLASASDVHGPIVPRTQYSGRFGNLLVYTMEAIPGVTPREIFPESPTMDLRHEILHEQFMKDLALYFANCFKSMQGEVTDLLPQLERMGKMHERLKKLPESSIAPYCARHVPEMIKAASIVYDVLQMRTLTHGDLNMTNFLIDPVTYHITGIVDWASAELTPFGLELYVVQLATGYYTAAGKGPFVFYDNHRHLKRVFWNELFELLAKPPHSRRDYVDEYWRPSWMLGLILREGFVHAADGSLKDEIIPLCEENLVQLQQLQTFLDDEDFFDAALDDEVDTTE